jgi:hypothetical protein
MARPFRGYRQLAAGAEIPSIALGAGRFLLVLGALVSVSATGRFAPAERGLAMVSFSWLPLVNALSIALTVRVFAPSVGWKRAFAFYLQGIGPWLVLFLFFIGGVLFARHSSDYHWGTHIGLCRTYVFVKEPVTVDAVMEALRARRTVVKDREGRYYGPPPLVDAIAKEPIPARAIDYRYAGEGRADRILRALGFFGLVGLVVLGSQRRKTSDSPR